jgi:hypothetical protein
MQGRHLNAVTMASRPSSTSCSGRPRTTESEDRASVVRSVDGSPRRATVGCARAGTGGTPSTRGARAPAARASGTTRSASSARSGRSTRTGTRGDWSPWRSVAPGQSHMMTRSSFRTIAVPHLGQGPGCSQGRILCSRVLADGQTGGRRAVGPSHGASLITASLSLAHVEQEIVMV